MGDQQGTLLEWRNDPRKTVRGRQEHVRGRQIPVLKLIVRVRAGRLDIAQDSPDTTGKRSNIRPHTGRDKLLSTHTRRETLYAKVRLPPEEDTKARIASEELTAHEGMTARKEGPRTRKVRAHDG